MRAAYCRAFHIIVLLVKQLGNQAAVLQFIELTQSTSY